MPNVSVIIPAYNAEAYIADTVRSVLAQTYPDFEVIVVDDGSTDGTVKALEPFGNQVRVHHQANSGVAMARNTGVGLASGTWIAFLDADDLWLPHKLERQLALSTASITYTDRFNIGARGELPEVQSEVTPMCGGDLFVPLMREGNFITNTSVVIRRVLFEQMGGFYTGLNGTEDWDLWIRIAERHEIGFVPEPLVRYRFHAGGISRNFVKMGRERLQVITRALALERGRALDWRTRRQIWSETWRTNAYEAFRAGARKQALIDYAHAAAAWPLEIQPYKEAVKVCLNAA
ncbi:MAG TPA: glycosyltransferase [Vicinamibacterales bacterium]|nr:glycosyltransferase [Vicinamibacterales bacterium]